MCFYIVFLQFCLDLYYFPIQSAWFFSHCYSSLILFSQDAFTPFETDDLAWQWYQFIHFFSIKLAFAFEDFNTKQRYFDAAILGLSV